MIQGTEEWMKARLGKCTGSRIDDVTAELKSGGWGASRDKYKGQLVAQRLTGIISESYTNADMQHGIDTEPEARIAYSFYTGREVKQVGFIDHPKVPMSGASPDGLVVVNGVLEIKCPSTHTHIETLLSGKIEGRYIKQMMWEMAVTDSSWADFVSYDNRMPEEMRLFVKRIQRDDKMIAKLTEQVTVFLSEVDATVDMLLKQYGTRAAA